MVAVPVLSYRGERAVLPKHFLPPTFENVAVPVPFARVQFVLPAIASRARVVVGRGLLGIVERDRDI